MRPMDILGHARAIQDKCFVMFHVKPFQDTTREPVHLLLNEGTVGSLLVLRGFIDRNAAVGTGALSPERSLEPFSECRTTAAASHLGVRFIGEDPIP